ncbi:uncharacterized protein LOC111464065 isoform X2 [Cucurbita moschata]|uniref:Uncharacterized protein LOC111464065 isoform X2 n=1 Tax=Cucurbita moschata TaxID=3662 RepID=A0A6J1HJA5_CUCMO|nr:uncharacterized protein LOC111464065 isoform X2 [Cucurbita moschata]
MAANQRRKRLSSASVVGYSTRDSYRVRKKNSALPHSDANLRSHITLVWDGSKRRVVSKREQVGLSWRKLRPFVDSVSNKHSILADVFDVPREIFELKNLSEVLSLEVWQTYLSENERNNLRRFLPEEQENENGVMEALFSGDNFHFGNSLVKWESSLCSGALHPDAVLQDEQCLMAAKKSYSCELQKYHNNMIEYLQKLKDRCANCKDPEKEIIHPTWRSRNAERRVSTQVNESRFDYHKDNAIATSESGSWAAEEKACSSDNKTSFMKGRVLSERLCSREYKQKRCRTSSTPIDDMLNVGTRPEVKLQMRNIQCSDGSKYMSYFKISKKQLDLVKNMKQSGSIDQVLGDMEAFNVQPYEVFVEEERKKLHEHWVQLSKVLLPVAYANWRETRLQRWKVTKALEQDLKDRQKLPMDVDTESHDSMLRDQMDTEETDQMDTEETDQMDREETRNESIEKSISGSQSCQSSEQVNGGLETYRNSDSENHETPNSGDAHLEESGISRNRNAIECSASQGESLHSIGDVRPEPSMPKNYHSSATSHDYATSISDLSLANSHADEERKTNVFNVEPDMPARGIAKSLLPRQSDDGSSVKSGLHGLDIGKVLLPRQSDNDTFVERDSHGRDIGNILLHSRSDDSTSCSYGNQGKVIGKHLLHRHSDNDTLSYENQGKDELLHSVFNRQGVAAPLSFHREERHRGLDFQPSNHDLIEENRYSRHFQEQPDLSVPLQQRRKEDEQVYLQHGVPENIYPEGNKYIIPTQQQLPSSVMQDWTVNSVPMPTHIHSHTMNAGSLLGDNWFPGEHQVRGGFTGSDGVIVPNQNIGSGNSSTDQILFSVLSQGSQFCSPFHSMGSNGQFISTRNHGVLHEGNPMIGNVLPKVSNSLDYLGGHEIPSQGISWVGMRHQNSNLTDPMEKPYLRSWNQ